MRPLFHATASRNTEADTPTMRLRHRVEACGGVGSHNFDRATAWRASRTNRRISAACLVRVGMATQCCPEPSTPTPPPRASSACTSAVAPCASPMGNRLPKRARWPNVDSPSRHHVAHMLPQYDSKWRPMTSKSAQCPTKGPNKFIERSCGANLVQGEGLNSKSPPMLVATLCPSFCRRLDRCHRCKRTLNPVRASGP